MMPIISVVPKALTIELDMISIAEMENILKHNQGYVDGDRKQLIVWCKK